MVTTGASRSATITTHKSMTVIEMLRLEWNEITTYGIQGVSCPVKYAEIPVNMNCEFLPIRRACPESAAAIDANKKIVYSINIIVKNKYMHNLFLKHATMLPSGISNKPNRHAVSSEVMPGPQGTIKRLNRENMAHEDTRAQEVPRTTFRIIEPFSINLSQEPPVWVIAVDLTCEDVAADAGPHLGLFRVGCRRENHPNEPFSGHVPPNAARRVRPVRVPRKPMDFATSLTGCTSRNPSTEPRRRREPGGAANRPTR